MLPLASELMGSGAKINFIRYVPAFALRVPPMDVAIPNTNADRESLPTRLQAPREC